MSNIGRVQRRIPNASGPNRCNAMVAHIHLRQVTVEFFLPICTARETNLSTSRLLNVQWASYRIQGLRWRHGNMSVQTESQGQSRIPLPMSSADAQHSNPRSLKLWIKLMDP
ncbi:hypothetical protein L798_14412 [Zootermopsis nevadensis]|uniref:Uncharacterized protein n=1 Tax=Zootermopsis nevadensis TaxID=136037 RepID=A0A067QPE1_ZOONE|nr:hypothetical protein L798_14412 [Zootermopsis nevadensis]